MTSLPAESIPKWLGQCLWWNRIGGDCRTQKCHNKIGWTDKSVGEIWSLMRKPLKCLWNEKLRYWKIGEFERPLKVKKNGVFLFVVSHLVPEIFKIFVLCKLGTDDVIRSTSFPGSFPVLPPSQGKDPGNEVGHKVWQYGRQNREYLCK